MNIMHINWQRTRDILICTICIGIIFWASWLVLGQFVDAIVILLLSMTVAFLLNPAVNFLESFKIPRLLATFIVYIVVLGLLGWLGYQLVFSLISQVQTFSETIKGFATSLPDTLSATRTLLEKQAHIPPSNIDAAIAQIQSQASEFATALATNAVNLVFVVTTAFLDILLVIVLSFYLTLDGKRIRSSLFSIVPRRSMPGVLIFDEALSRVVGNYIRGQLTLAVIVGMATSFFCIFTGLEKYALICGVLAFLFETIPMVGPGLASITPIILSILQQNPIQNTLILAACFLCLQIVESNILGPRIVGHAVGLHPVAAILTLLVGAKLFGLFGALIATPVVAAGWVVITSIYRSAKGETPDQILARKRASWTIPLSLRGGSQENPREDTPDEKDGIPAIYDLAESNDEILAKNAVTESNDEILAKNAVAESNDEIPTKNDPPDVNDEIPTKETV
jgi:predicted PurR-regulated permease PerM